jgi:hypothetical protein
VSNSMDTVETYLCRELLAAFGDWVEEFVHQEYRHYLITFRFNHILGNPRSVVPRMMQDVEHFYRTLLKWIVRRPRTAPIDRLPRLIALPDRPIYRQDRQALSDVRLNNGLHIHGVIAIPPNSRLAGDLGDHVRGQMTTYTDAKYTRIRHIDVAVITSRASFTTGYGLKLQNCDPSIYDDLLILPLSSKEVPPRQRRDPQQRPERIRCECQAVSGTMLLTRAKPLGGVWR